MRIIVLHSSPRKNGNTRAITDEVLAQITQQHDDVELKHYQLSDCTITPCKGCFSCLRNGWETCPLKDDVQNIYQDLLNCDAIILASPVYVMGATAQIKTLIDRMSFLCHQPQLQHVDAYILVTTAAMGHKDVAKYLTNIATVWGCKTTTSLAVITPPNNQMKTDSLPQLRPEITKKTSQFIQHLENKQPSQPAFLQIIQFHAQRKIFSTPETEQLFPSDYAFWKQRTNKTYHVPARINPIKAFIAKLMITLLYRS